MDEGKRGGGGGAREKKILRTTVLGYTINM
jgi:hypothetical protein